MSSLGSYYRLETWRRGAPVRGTIAQLVLLAALTPSALSGRSGSAWATNLALCLAAAVWSLVSLHPGLRKRAPVMAVFVAGVVAISFALVIRDPWFGFYAYAGFTYSIVLLRWPWQLAGVAATAVVAATSQTAGLDRATPAHMAAYAGILASNMLAYCGVTWFLHRIETQHQQRGQMLDELRESNRRLEAALAWPGQGQPRRSWLRRDRRLCNTGGTRCSLGPCLPQEPRELLVAQISRRRAGSA